MSGARNHSRHTLKNDSRPSLAKPPAIASSIGRPRTHGRVLTVTTNFLPPKQGLSNCDDVVPFYVGDDRTNEDAFKVLREGNRGYGISVSSHPKESNAFYFLEDPSEVMEFLKQLVAWNNKSSW